MLYEGEMEKRLIDRCIKGLINYGGGIKWKSNEQGIYELKRFICCLAEYWNMDEKVDWEKTAEEGLEKEIVCLPTDGEKLSTLLGLYYYMDELLFTHGTDAVKDIRQAQELLKAVAEEWDVDEAPIQIMCIKIDNKLESEKNTYKIV